MQVVHTAALTPGPDEHDAMLDTLGGRRAFASGLDGDKLCIFKRG